MNEEKNQISLYDLISEVSESVNDEEKEEKNFIKDFQNREKYLKIINALEEKKKKEELWEVELEELNTKLKDKYKLKQEKDAFSSKVLMGGILLIFAVATFLFSWKLGAFLITLMQLFFFFLFKNMNKINIIEKRELKEKIDFKNNYYNGWNIFKEKNKDEKYNPYILSYYYLEKTSKKINKELLANIFNNFSFESINMNIEEISNLFFFSELDKNEMRNYHMNGIVPMYIRYLQDKENITNKLYEIAYKYEKKKMEVSKEKLLNSLLEKGDEHVK